MKRMSAIAAFLVLAIVSAQAAYVQDAPQIEGKWKLTFETPQGSQTADMTLKVDGEKLTGSLQGPQGEQTLSG
ncbi:MAG: hypothetical protein HY646_12330, partial [Acidobacteria bacterium]|nr:hypothetical protein [Acidobacteriota bacterium]